MNADTHCKHGHKWTDENTYWYLDKRHDQMRRKCKTCTCVALKRNRRTAAQMREQRTRPHSDVNQDNDSLESIRANRLAHMQEELDRETRAWVRREMIEEIEREKARSR